MFSSPPYITAVASSARSIYVHWLDASSPLTSAEARQLARALMAAADACDRAADEIDNGTGTVAP
jgi:hypothetical protein